MESIKKIDWEHYNIEKQNSFIRKLMEKVRQIVRRVLLNFYVAPINSIIITSIKELSDVLLFMVTVKFINYRTGERPEIVIPMVYNKKEKKILLPSVFYYDRKLFLLDKNSIKSLFILHPVEYPAFNFFSPLAPQFYKNLNF